MELELVPKEAFGSDEKPRTSKKIPAYSGKERRKLMRRIMVDRRNAVRFEDRQDRRLGFERRTELRIWDGRGGY